MGGMLISYSIGEKGHSYLSKGTNTVSGAIQKFKKDNKDIIPIISSDVLVYNGDGVLVSIIKKEHLKK